IKTITDVNGKIIYNRQPQSHRVITRTVAGLMNEILQQAVRYGTGSSAAIAVASAGKTGTTTDSRDLWYVGYIDELATAVWVGNSDNTAVTGYRTYGGAVAAPIWRDYMNKLYYNYWLEQKPVPQEVTEPLPEENEEPEENPEETNEETNPENPEETPDNTEPELPGMPDESETTAPPAETEQTTNLPAPEPIIPREAAGF
ncbi:MAG: penicillin-binding transpeptidase domain-containing protein, partial [Syntrophomonadaceae bacterium]|nr:penicillin-binding transpeptidase domain-containing protein [Syntrophomonadaceae bacterium]